MSAPSEPPSTLVWEFGPFRLDALAQRLFRDGAMVPLRPKAFAVLSYLVEQAGRLVDKNQLLDAVWGHRHVSESALEGCISELRKALDDDAKAPRYLKTVSRRGYCIVAEMKPAAAGAGGGLTLPVSRMPAAADHRVGREAPLVRLQDMWREARGGRRQLVFLNGEAGLGKTTLIEIFLQSLVQESPAVLWGQCIDHVGAGEAFLPLLGALQQRGASLSPLLRARAPAWLVQLPGVLTPEQRLELQPEVLGATRERMLREGCELLEALSAEAPLILVLEDLHWSDNATLDLLAWLARRRAVAGLMVIGSYRPSDLAWRDHPLQQVRQELRSHRLCSELSLGVFTPAELDAYLARRFPDRQFPEDIARLLYERSGGHPLFLVNLLDYLLAEGHLKPSGSGWSVSGDAETLAQAVPESLRQMIDRQLALLSPEQQRLLEAMSAVGIESSAALLAAALDHDLLAVEERCETLSRRGPLLTAVGMEEWPDGTVAGNYAFRHALYGEVLYQRLPPAYRTSLHRRLGERLEAAYLGRADEIASELARHFEAGRNFAKAVHYLRLAASQSAGRFAYREALNFLGRAMAWTEHLSVEMRQVVRRELLQERARVHQALNDWHGAIEDLAALVSLARAEDRRQEEVAGLIDMSLALFFCDRPRSMAAAAEAVSRSIGLADGALAIFAAAQQAYLGFEFSLWSEQYLPALVAAVAAAREAQQERALANYLRAQAIVNLCEQADYQRAYTAAQEIARIGEKLGDGFHYKTGQYFSTWALLSLGRWAELTERLAESMRLAEQNASLSSWSTFHLVKVALHLEALDFQGARDLAEGLESWVSGLPHAEPLQLILLGWANLGLGRPGEALRHFGKLAEAVQFVELYLRMQIRYGLGASRLAMGELAAARSETLRFLDLATPPRDWAHLALGHRLSAQIALAERDQNAAETHITRALSAIEGKDVPLAAWRVYETAAEIYASSGRTGEARAFAAQAANILQCLADSLGDAPESQALRQSLLSHPLLQGVARKSRQDAGR